MCEQGPIEVLRMTKVRYDDGTCVWLELRPDMADMLRRLDQTEARRERRRKEREKTFSEMGIQAGLIVASPWIGPRLKFTWLVGESRTWDGEPTGEIEGEPCCSICLGAELPPNAYCLGCDRCGRELEIPGPGQVARTVAPKAGELRGGLEGKR